MEKPVFHNDPELEQLRARIEALEAPTAVHSSRGPDWQGFVASLKLPGEIQDPQAARRELVSYLRRTSLFPPADQEGIKRIVLDVYLKLPTFETYFETYGNLRGVRLCSCFRYLAKMALQGSSLFPGDVKFLADRIQSAVERAMEIHPKVEADTFVDPLLGLLVGTEPAVGSGKLQLRSGLNFDETADPNSLLLHQRKVSAGAFAEEVRRGFKMEEHRRKVLATPEFLADWRFLQGSFDVHQYTDALGRIYRSGVFRASEGAPGAPGPDAGSPFRVVFDFFCWKWFLDGMEGNRPIVATFRYRVTPFGTEIFIPGYWSVDFTRDIAWKRVAEVHRARGLGKQGETLAEQDPPTADRLRRVLIADKVGRGQGYTGRRLIEFIGLAAGLAPKTNDRTVRDYVKRARERFRAQTQPELFEGAQLKIQPEEFERLPRREPLAHRARR